MAILTDLDWIKSLDEFSDEEQKVMLALSDERYKWRSRARLKVLTDLSTKRLERTLAHLITDDLVRPAFSRNRNIIFGLRERVG